MTQKWISVFSKVYKMSQHFFLQVTILSGWYDYEYFVFLLLFLITSLQFSTSFPLHGQQTLHTESYKPDPKCIDKWSSISENNESLLGTYRLINKGWF